MPEKMESFVYNGVELTEYRGTNENIIIPEGVVSIGAGAFSNNRIIRSVEFPATLVEIGENAFRGCSSLSSIKINDGLKTIRKYAFFACKINSVLIPESVAIIERCAFTDPPNSELTIHCKKRSYAEKYAREQGFVIITETSSEQDRTVQERDTRLINAYQALISSDEKTVIIPDGIEYISCCFSHDLEIEKVVFPKTVRIIEKDAFSRCHNLIEAVFSEGIKEIGERAFHSSGLREVAFPNGLETIGKGAFQYCGRMEKARFPAGLRIIGEKAFLGTAIKELQFKESLREIRNSAFAYCSSLKTVALSESLHLLGTEAFAFCNLDVLKIPCTEAQLGEKILYANHGTKVFIKQNMNGIGLNTFEGTHGVVVITEDETLQDKLKGIKNLAVIKAPYDEDYDYREHLKNDEGVPLALWPISYEAYRLLSQNDFTSINQVLMTPLELLPEGITITGKNLKQEIIEATIAEKRHLA